MDDRDFEARLAARLHVRFDRADAPDSLLLGLSEGVRDRAPRVRRSRRLWVVTASTAVLVGATVAAWALRPALTPIVGESPSPWPTVTASPDTVPTRPFHLSLLGGGSPEPTIVIGTPSDCDVLPTDWLRVFCTLTLLPDWGAIVAQTDPQAASASWQASMARASIDGDTSLCADVAMREWVTLGGGLGGAPPAGPTPTSVHPIAACLAFLRSVAANGTLSVTDPAGMPTIRVSVDPGATEHAARGLAPTLDPGLACGEDLTKDACARLIEAVSPALGSRGSEVLMVSGYAGLAGCSTAATPCPPPAGGRWLGSVVASLKGNEILAFVVADVGGRVTATQVPFIP